MCFEPSVRDQIDGHVTGIASMEPQLSPCLSEDFLPPWPRFHGVSAAEKGDWRVTSFAAAKTLLVSPNLIQCARRNYSSPDRARGAFSVVNRGKYLWSLCSNAFDPPDWNRFRSGFAAKLSPECVFQLESVMRKRAADRLASIFERNSVELLAEFIHPIINQTLLGLIGVNIVHQAHVAEQSMRLLRFGESYSSDGAPKGGRRANAAIHGGAAFVLASLGDWLKGLLDSSLPEDAWLGLSVQAAVRSGVLSEDEGIGQLLELIFAGTSTVSQALAGLLARLSLHRETWRKFHAGEIPVQRIIEEGLRLGPPHLVLPRIAAEDFEIEGHRIRRGDDLSIDLQYANLDPARFTDPDRFDPDRTEGAHLAFGAGLHRCVGMHLGRLQLKVALETLLRFFPVLPAPTALEFGPGFHNRPAIKTLKFDLSG
jgi:cytochrome P450